MLAGGARERECSPQQGSLSSTTAAKHELLPESTMTAEELRRVHSKKSEEEKMKQRLLSSTHDSPARQSCGAGSLAVDAVPASAGGGVAQTPPRASRESLLQDLEKIRQERALEEVREPSCAVVVEQCRVAPCAAQAMPPSCPAAFEQCATSPQLCQ